MKNKIIFISMICVFTILFLIKFPLVFFSNKISCSVLQTKYLDKVYSLNNMDDTNCEVVIYISYNDLKELPIQIKNHKVIYTEDLSVIQKLKKNFCFEKKVGDMTTCESRIVIYSNDKVIFESNIVINNNFVGVQGDFGWAEAIAYKKVIEIFSEFKPKYAPFIYFGDKGINR